MADMPSGMEPVLGALYDTLDGSVPWEDAMESLTRLTGAERISLTWAGHDGSVRQDSYPFDPAGVVEYAVDYADKDLRVARILTQGRRGVLRTQDLMSPAEIARCPVHNEYYRKYPECWNTVAVPLDVDGGVFAPVFHRGAKYGLFEDEECRRVEIIASHLARLADLSRMIPPSGLSSDGVVAALDGLDDGLFVLDQSGQVLHMNAAANSIVMMRDGLELSNKIPVATHPEARGILITLISDLLSAAEGETPDLPQSVTLPRPDRGKTLHVRGFVAPPLDGHRRLAILTVRRIGPKSVPSVEAVRLAGALTAAEARAAHALVRGLSVRDYAHEAGLSEQTVRFQLKRVREKLGVRRQAGVVSVILRQCGVE